MRPHATSTTRPTSRAAVDRGQGEQRDPHEDRRPDERRRRVHRSRTRPTSASPTADDAPNARSAPLTPPGSPAAASATGRVTNVKAAKCPTSAEADETGGHRAPAATGRRGWRACSSVDAGATALVTTSPHQHGCHAAEHRERPEGHPPVPPLRDESLASGAPMTVPRVAPPSTTATPVARECDGTMSAACALTVAHNSPTAEAPASRPPTAAPRGGRGRGQRQDRPR